MSGTLIIIPTEAAPPKEIRVESRTPSYDLLRSSVGGLIQPVKVRWNGVVRQAYVNEEGIPLNLPLNRTARKLIADYYRTSYLNIQEISGPMAIWVPDKRSKK
jgi:hypothetical protein